MYYLAKMEFGISAKKEFLKYLYAKIKNWGLKEAANETDKVFSPNSEVVSWHMQGCL